MTKAYLVTGWDECGSHVIFGIYSTSKEASKRMATLWKTQRYENYYISVDAVELGATGVDMELFL